ncbi:MAG: hypothetical protein PHY08_08500 [Candidatus Cloacimonetes bacterium]|nr:hypothetical protein [Candidatus Cloacimonadota bacterium]
MPKVGRGRPPSNKPKIEELTCLSCGLKKKSKDFYVSSSVFNADTGKVTYCKECRNTLSIDKTGVININKFQGLLEKIDKPFLKDVLQSAYEESKKEGSSSPVGLYFKNINSLSQYKNLTWKDSVFENKEIQREQINKATDFTDIADDFIITKDMVIKWGNGFESEQYMMLEDLYQNLFNSYDIDNRSQEEYLKTACLYQLRNIEAIRNGNAQEATKWGGLFDSYMASGKLKPSQLSESDKMGGVTNFATFFQYIEKSNNFIPTFPDLILDDIDYSIFMFLNYNRTLMGLPEVSLGEVKNFMTYDYQKGQEIIFPTLSEEMFNDIENGDDDGSI